MDFTQNLLKNWILGGNLVVDKTLRKLHKATTSRDNDICYNCYAIVSSARQRLYNTITVSRSVRAKTEQKSAQKRNKEEKEWEKELRIIQFYVID